MPVKKYLKESIKLGDKDLTVETGRVAKQADGSVIIQYGDTMLLVAAVGAPHVREGIDFFPLTVEYRDANYAAGRLPGWFELALPRPAEIHLALYDVRGREIARLLDGAAPAGVHRVALPAAMRRGVYFGRVHVRSEDGVRTRTDRVLVL